MRAADVAEQSSMHMADEAMSAGRYAIENPTTDDAIRIDAVINGSFQSWRMAANRLQNDIRDELAPGSEHVPIDEGG
jgi:hypothetical protein